MEKPKGKVMKPILGGCYLHESKHITEGTHYGCIGTYANSSMSFRLTKEVKRGKKKV